MSVYRHALYYDILFGWDRYPESWFYDAVFQIHGLNHGDSLLEVGCGTGRVGCLLAGMEWRVTGLDVKPEMLSFLQQRALDRGVTVQTLQADMCDFAVPVPFAGALCPMGSLGHLMEDRAILSHLACMNRALKPGGLYVVDLGFTDGPTVEWDYREDDWGLERDGVSVTLKDGELHIVDPRAGAPFTIPWDVRLRLFQWDHFFGLVQQSGFSLVACYPEADVTEEGISVFDPMTTQSPPPIDRAMVVLRSGA